MMATRVSTAVQSGFACPLEVELALDYWIDAAFSTGGLVGHLSYILLVVSMMMRDISALRLLVIASALAGIAYDLIWLRNPVGVFWEGLLLLVNVVQLYLLWRKNRSAQFTQEEAQFVSTRLKGLSAGRCRDFFDMGRWEYLPSGSVLTRQNERPEFLAYLSKGTASIIVDDQEVAAVQEGHYIGEMSLLGDGNASATVIVTEPARVWRIEAEKIERLMQDRPNIANALQAGIAVDMRRKIVALNSVVTTGERP
jgi:hypothetical protein